MVIHTVNVMGVEKYPGKWLHVAQKFHKVGQPAALECCGQRQCTGTTCTTLAVHKCGANSVDIIARRECIQYRQTEQHSSAAAQQQRAGSVLGICYLLH